MNLTHIVRTFGYGLYGKLLQSHVLGDDFLQRLDCRIHRTVTRRGCLKLLSAYIQADTCHALNAHTGCYLQEIEFHGMSLGSIRPNEHEDVVVVNFLLLVGNLQEFLIDNIEFGLVIDIHAEYLEAELQRCAARTCRQYN